MQVQSPHGNLGFNEFLEDQTKTKMHHKIYKKVVLVILDGFGSAPDDS